MAPLSKLTLARLDRAEAHKDPVIERRSKALAGLHQQRLVLAELLEGRVYTVKRRSWRTDGEGNRHLVEKDQLIRPWFLQQDQGWFVQLKYGARTVPLDDHNNAVVVSDLADVASVLDIFEKSIETGHFDQSLAQLAQRNKKLPEASDDAGL